MRNKHHHKKWLSLLLAAVMLFSIVPTAFAAQGSDYHDPAEHWKESNNRTVELDVNAHVSHETFFCAECGKTTSFTAFRTPEYTRDGKTALTRNVLYSDGTMTDGSTKGSILDGTPGKDAFYTGYHWTKAVCDTCGTLNSNMGRDNYCYGKNVYHLYDCAHEFMEILDETVEIAYVDDTYHSVTIKSGDYCAFCYGTHHTEKTELVRHDLHTDSIPQLGHQRFAVVKHCEDCGYSEYSFVAAKSVVADYYGVVDGKPHTITVSDLSESGVSTVIRYGNSADACTLTSAPNFTEAGEYAVYYAITYSYKGESMTENGVANVWLREEKTAEDGGCACGCGDKDCGCQDKNCNGKSCCDNGKCGDHHSFVLLDSVKPTCLTLGYDRYLCSACGKIEKRDYTNATGHSYQSVVIREATCEADGKIMEICKGCGDVKVTTTPKGEHRYKTYTVKATCTAPGYTVKECSVCGDRHITDITSALPHNYKATVIPATCESGGKTIHTCEGCGSSFTTDYTQPLGHSFDKGTKVTSSTCDGEGVMEYRCVRCGYHYLEGVSAEGHKPGLDATCTEPQICLTCGVILKLPTGHKAGEWIIDKEPTIDAEGSKHTECEHCKTVLQTEIIPKLDKPAPVYHSAYIVGYPDGTFGPERNMTRSEAAAIFARLLSAKKGDTIRNSANTRFEDVSENAWYSGYVRYLTGYGIVAGTGEKTFSPDEAITRAEFVTMAVRFFESYGDGAAAIMEKYAGFNDVSSGYWAAKYIEEASARGWIKGYGDGSFRGGREITRAEVVTIVNRLLDRTMDRQYLSDNPQKLTRFSDMTTEHWAYYDVLEASNSHTADMTKGEVWSR
jgi:S-layer homology domain.